MRCKVVTGYVPLDVKHLTLAQFKALGNQWISTDVHVFEDFPLEECWLYPWLAERDWLKLQPACDVPADRFETPRHMVMSNIVMHQRTRFMAEAANLHPEAEVLVWVDYGITKQGEFTGKPVQAHHVQELVERIERSMFSDIPFPGIWPGKAAPADYGPNWRFAGSVHIIPREHVYMVDEFYRYECRKFIDRTKTVPLDLPIWALTELNSTLPFRFYQANHDATQFTNFPYPRPEVTIKDYEPRSPHVCTSTTGNRCDICFELVPDHEPRAGTSVRADLDADQVQAKS